MVCMPLELNHNKQTNNKQTKNHTKKIKAVPTVCQMEEMGLPLVSSKSRRTDQQANFQHNIDCHDDYFNALVELIPKAIYLGKTDEEREADAMNSKFHKHKKKSAQKQQKKEDAKKAKKKRYDVENQKTVLETQQQESDQQEEESGDQNSKKKSEINPEPMEIEPVEERQGDSIETLRLRLQAKIKALKGKRNDAEKKSDKRGNKNASKKNDNKKSKNSQEKQNKHHQDKQPPKSPSIEKKTKQPKLQKDANHKEDASPKPDTATLPNVDENFSFGSLTLPEDKTQKRKNQFGQAKNLHKLLEKAEAKRQRLAELKQTEEGKERANREEWGDMLRQAQGQKAQDDPKRLKNAIKKKEKKKEKSRKKWQERDKNVKEGQAARQQKREANLQQRKKGGGAAKKEEEGEKPSRRAGFEGKKSGFLNDKDNKKGGREGGFGDGKKQFSNSSHKNGPKKGGGGGAFHNKSARKGKPISTPRA